MGPFPDPASVINFTPGQMSLPSSNNRADLAERSPLQTFVSPLGMSGVIQFTEYPAALGQGSFYSFAINSPGGFGVMQTCWVNMDDTGLCIVQFGLASLCPQWTGTWTPNNGSHRVYFAIDSLGTPTLVIDGVNIPLVNGGDSTSISAFYDPDKVVVQTSNQDPALSAASVTKIAMATTIFPPDVNFCCS